MIRSIPDPLALALIAPGTLPDTIRARVASLKPNYITELIAMSDSGSTGRVLESLAAALADVEGYVGIPYYSKHNKVTVDLFDKVAIVDRSPLAMGERILALEHMEPFADFGAIYEYSLSPPDPLKPGTGFLYFTSENTSPISYRGVRSVKAGDMTWYLYAFAWEGKVVFYGVGAVRAFDMLGVIRDRLEVSFMGRVEAFMGHMAGVMGKTKQGVDR